MCGNPVGTFPIKQRINGELFMDRIAALYKGQKGVRVVTNKGDQPVAASLLKEQVYLAQKF